MNRNRQSAIRNSALVLFFLIASALSMKAQDRGIFFDMMWNDDFGFISEKYTNRAYAQDLENREINYSLTDAPQGMTIDAEDGLITWYPSVSGSYTATIKAYLKNDPSVYATSELRVSILGKSHSAACGTIKGKALNLQGNPINGAYVTVIKYQQDSKAIDFTDAIYTKTDDKGNYSLNVNKGRYFVFIYGNLYPIFYGQNEFDFEPIDIKIDCNDTYTADFETEELSYAMKDKVFFVSYPQTTMIEKGTKFTYTFKAISFGDVDIAYQPTNFPDGTIYDAATRTIEFTPQEDGQYDFFIKAYDRNNEFNFEEQYIMLQVMDQPNYDIVFENWPDKEFVEYGKLFTFDVNAVHTYNKELEYEFVEAPVGATIDKTTGVITWTPDKQLNPDIYVQFNVKAYLKDNPEEFNTMMFMLYIQPDYCSKIEGYVTDQDNKPVPGAWIMVMPVDPESDFWFFRSEIVTDDNGFYSIEAPEGDYILQVWGGMFKPQFYSGKYEYEDADILSVECDVTANANFNVEILHPNYYKVSGHVTDQSTGEPVKAYVEFISEYNDWGWMAIPDYQPFAMTDEDGYYEVTLPDIMEYKVLAYPAEYDYDEYLPEFYNNVYDYLSAEKITLTGDRVIDFALSKPYDFDNSFAGTVVDTEGEPVEADIIAMNFDSSDDEIFWGFMNKYAKTDDEGKYEVKNMVPGKYLVMALPSRASLSPGMYKENDIATLNWEEATLIEIGENEKLTKNHKIVLPEMSEGMGFGKIDGYVEGSDNREGLDGAIVSVIDANGKTAGYDFSEKGGKFNIEKLGRGEFQILVEKQGYEPYKGTIEISEEMNLSKNIVLQAKTTGIEDNPQAAPEMAVYPNPASKTVVLSFEAATTGSAKITVSDMSGNKVMTESRNLTSGVNLIALEVSSLPQGTYIVEVDGAGVKFSKSLQVVR